MNEKELLKLIVKEYYETQKYRVRLGNRLKLKKDGESQKIDGDTQGDYNLSANEFVFLEDSYNAALNREKEMEKLIHKRLKDFPIYQWFKSVKGVGDMMAAILITSIDIEKASTVSKIWQFSGLNSGEVRGMKKSSLKPAKENGFEIVREYTNLKGEKECIIRTDERIRGDKLKAGFLSPFNQWLRTKLIGVLAGSFIKSNSPYRQFYDNMKNRELSKGTPKGHAHNRALRYMVKMFLIDMHKVWRELEGLSVREPYQVEYLGKKHEV